MIGRYLRGVLIALDQAANAILFGGFPDETLSSRMGRRLKRKRRALESEAACAVLDALDDNHCADAIEETPDGETDAHHLGRVIHELPPAQGELRKLDDAFHRAKRSKFVIVGALFLALGGCAGFPVVVVPAPAPSPSGPPASVPTPIPEPSPEQTPPPPPPPPPTPAPPAGPVCRDGCVSCAQWIKGELASGALTRCEPGKAPSCRVGLAYNLVGGDANRPEFTSIETCLMTDASGNTRNRRHHNDGSVCEPGCVKATPPPPPTPAPTPQPTPTPQPPRPTPAPGVVPPFTESGNYPLPDLGTCPPWFADATAHVGIRVAGQTPCGQGRVCRRVTLWATQKSIPPYCEHSCYDEAGNYNLANCRRECETWAGCQEPQFVDYVGGGENPGGGIQMLISHPDWGNTWGRLDKQTCAAECPPGMTNPVHNFNGHDRAVDRAGITRARACMPDGTKCTETTYRTDQ